MNLFYAFFYRRLIYISHNWIGELSIALFLPIGIFITLGFGLSDSIPSLNYVSKLSWLIPGIVLIISFSGALITIFNDVAKHKQFSGIYGSLYVSPSTSSESVFAIILSVLPEGIIRSLFAFIILQLIIGNAFPIIGQISFLLFIIVSILIGSSIGLVLGVLSKNNLSNQLVIILILLSLGFFSGWFVPLNVFPESIHTILTILPTTILGEYSRGVLFQREIPFSLFFIPIASIIMLVFLNIFLFSRISTE
tara:strand:+ start:24327 stop:25079 length:753 start_codon:yes stop_codon:yes gene_type:complete